MAYSQEAADRNHGSIEHVIQQYAAGKTLKELADERGCSFQAVWDRLRRRAGQSKHRAALYQSLLARIARIEGNLNSVHILEQARARKQSRSERYRLSQLFPDLHPWPKRTRKSKQRSKKSVAIKDVASD